MNITANFQRMTPSQWARRLLLFGAFLFITECVRAESDEMVILKDESVFGSGSAVENNLYFPGGIPGVGLFVGNPNSDRRNDRAIFRFEIDKLRDKISSIKRVELVFTIATYYSQDDQLEIEIEHVSPITDALSGEELNNTSADVCAIVSISADDSATVTANAPEQRVDVTAAVKADLLENSDSTTFRLKIPLIEGRSVAGNSDGITVSSEEIRRPHLRFVFE